MHWVHAAGVLVAHCARCFGGIWRRLGAVQPNKIRAGAVLQAVIFKCFCTVSCRQCSSECEAFPGLVMQTLLQHVACNASAGNVTVRTATSGPEHPTWHTVNQLACGPHGPPAGHMRLPFHQAA